MIILEKITFSLFVYYITEQAARLQPVYSYIFNYIPIVQFSILDFLTVIIRRYTKQKGEELWPHDMKKHPCIFNCYLFYRINETTIKQ